MLAKANRLVRADDYRRLVRRGRRVSTRHAVVYIMRGSDSGAPRFGFIVPKNVGIAVNRNLVRRRLKALSFTALPQLAPGTEIVIRALPGSAQAGWDILRSEISEVVSGGVTRA
ncbi:ribonuclease P protein component [Glaciihabitans sp. INWT7]|uniref:ribonuclease P protein component n=1 Tax=Glaciihabitans sp. INWT7 TaxID=2596912 RepID=UPI0016291803|nr:ribonuclease P protein component [Glaciihabitans sp. INWT7]QNE48261.1 ribonuclease P protein component [Glaciihabitans sp. INWT7]